MEERVSAADANRNFSELLRGVRKGRTYVVTSHGEPVAKLAPTASDEVLSDSAREALLSRLSSQKPVRGSKARRRWRREELYEDAR